MSNNVTVSSGQDYQVSSGQTDNGDTVQAGGELDVLSGGTIIGTFNDFGTIIVDPGGVEQGTVISGANAAVEYDDGSASGDTVDFALQVVEAGGMDSAITINYRGEQQVNSGGTAVFATVNGGGTQFDFGTTSGTVLSGSSPQLLAEQVVEAGSTASNARGIQQHDY
jgi:autotransporter passenger strand-loop-strand repeat protein